MEGLVPGLSGCVGDSWMFYGFHMSFKTCLCCMPLAVLFTHWQWQEEVAVPEFPVWWVPGWVALFED